MGGNASKVEKEEDEGLPSSQNPSQTKLIRLNPAKSDHRIFKKRIRGCIEDGFGISAQTC